MKKFAWFFSLSLAVLGTSCVPLFSDMQSARMVGKGKFEATPGFSSVSGHFDGDNEVVQNEFGVQAAYGISEKIDLRFRFENIGIKGSGSETFQVIGVGPKFSLLKDRIALYTPVGFVIGEKESWEFQPTMLFTVPIVPSKVDFNPSVKAIFPFCEDCETLMAVNAGLGLSTDISKWAIRPEYGLLFNPGEKGNYSHFSIGLSLNFSNLLKKKEGE